MALVEQLPRARRQILECYLHRQIDSRQAITLLGLSRRQFWRLLAAYRESGAKSLPHGNRGRRPGNATSEDIAARVVELARDRYPDANHTHLVQLLEEREDIQISRQTLRRILVAAGLKSPRRRRPPRHRVRRERMPREGMLIQIDGSQHRWLGDEHPQLTLHLAVDDATGRVLAALFRPDEDTCGYFELLGGLIRNHGIPLALYSDRHSVFVPAVRSGRPSQAEGATQFARAMSELGIRQIFAGSPQAKGRVERAAGTFQDRLVTELRLDGVSTLNGANYLLGSFIARFNRQFAVAPAQPQAAYRSLDPDLDLDLVLSFRHSRRVARDNTVRYRWQAIQLLPSGEHPTYAGSRVEVIEHTDGRLRVAFAGRIVPSQLVPPKPGLMRIGASADKSRRTLERQLKKVAQLPEVVPVKSKRKPRSPDEPDPRRQPTPCQVARWEAVQLAKSKGLSLRAIARELGIARMTVIKYAKSPHPPLNRFGEKAAAEASRVPTGAIGRQESRAPVH